MATKYYMIFDKKCVQKKGLDKCFLRSTTNPRNAKVYVSNDPTAYIVKKVGKKDFLKLTKYTTDKYGL
jgi:hypothetical protein